MSETAPLPPEAAPAPRGRLRLRTLVVIRWIALLGQAITLSVVYFGLDYPIVFVPAMAVIALAGVLNVVLSVARSSATWVSDREALWHLCFDVVQLAVLLGLTGGLQNPFAILILAPVVVSGWALSRRSTLIISALAWRWFRHWRSGICRCPGRTAVSFSRRSTSRVCGPPW